MAFCVSRVKRLLANPMVTNRGLIADVHRTRVLYYIPKRGVVPIERHCPGTIRLDASFHSNLLGRVFKGQDVAHDVERHFLLRRHHTRSKRPWSSRTSLCGVGAGAEELELAADMAVTYNVLLRSSALNMSGNTIHKVFINTVLFIVRTVQDQARMPHTAATSQTEA